MSTLSVSNINGVTSLSGGGFDALGVTANNGNTQSIAAFIQANNVAGAVTTANNTAVAAFAVANTANAAVASAGSITGSIINYANTTAPSGYLACDGNVYSRSAYSALASVIGTPAMISSFTAEYSNSSPNWSTTSVIIGYANGVAFVSNTNIVDTINQFAGGLLTSTDGSTWTPRTSSPFFYDNSNKIINGAIAANTAGGIWALVRKVNNNIVASANVIMTSSDLVTWTNRTITVANPPSYNKWSLNGLVGGGTSNRLVALFSYYFDCCGSINQGYRANTATSDDAGATWSFTNSLFPLSSNNITTYPSIAATSAGFLVTHGNTAFFSATGQTWSDISANLRSALGISASANVSNAQFFYNTYSANNQFIIPARGSKFLVSTSANGANGNWTTVTPDTTMIAGITYGFGADDYNWFYYWNASLSGGASIMHNGDVFAFYRKASLHQLIYSKDLKYWFRATDINYPGDLISGASTLYHDYTQFKTVAMNNGKFLMMLNAPRTIVSFTSNTAYTAATQFPVPKITNQFQYFPPQIGSPAIPFIPYIKT